MRWIATPSVCAFVACMATPLLAADIPSGSGSTTSFDGRWTASLNSETRAFVWHSDRAFPPSLVGTATPANGTQVYTPYAFSLDGRVTPDLKLENLVRSGYVYSRQSSAAATGTYSGSVDTSISSTATYYGFDGVQPFVSLNVNAPTGTTNLQGSAGNAILDSDVVDAAVFGQGWNVGPVVGVNLPLRKNLVVSLSFGYTYQGPFDRASAFVGKTNRIHPGSDYTATANVRYRTGDWRFGASASYLVETQATIDGVAHSRSGDRITLGGNVGYAWTDNWFSRVSATYSHQRRNWVAVIGAADLVQEAFDSNSDVVTVALDTTYSKGPFEIGPTATFMVRNRNDYDPSSGSFQPQKTKYSVGGVASYDVSKKISVNGRVEYMWLQENTNPLSNGFLIPGFLSNAWVFVLGGTAHF